MTLPTNADVYDAIAKVLSCRDSRRGRKPALVITIITNENGKTVITDHNTDCTAEIGKRTYTHPTKAAAPSMKRTVAVTVTDGGVRISPRTGNPMRPYKAKVTTEVVTPYNYSNTIKQAREAVCAAKARAHAMSHGASPKNAVILASSIVLYDARIAELDALIAAQK